MRSRTIAETEHQLTRLEQVFEQLEERPRAKPCAGMAGIIEEGSELLKGDFPEAVMDAQRPRAARKGWRRERTEPAGHGRAKAAEERRGRRRPGVNLGLVRPNAVAAERISADALAACHG